MTKKHAFIIAIIFGGLGLSGCTPVGVVAGTGAAVGVASVQEGGIKTAAADASIKIQITDAWLQKNASIYGHLSMTVKEGRVLLTGSVPTPDMRVDAVRMAWRADGVRQVINEIKVDDGNGVGGYVKDTWITSDIKTHILFDKYVESINYSVDTVGGTVYLMGIAKDQKELDRVIDHARTTKYVKDVVNYVRLRNEAALDVPPPPPAAMAPPASFAS